MKSFRARRGHHARGSAGFTLVEVLIAMMIFAILAIGIAASLASTLRMTSDAREREAAANLAAEQIDLLRSVADIFTITSEDDKAVPLNGVVYHVKRSIEWKTTGGDDARCGSGGGSLQYKRINITVTWDGMRSTTPAVRADTIVAPNGRINDPSLGTILVSVLNASGTGSAGVAVSATRTAIAGNTAVTPTDPILNTDAQGCTYILKVTPGTYDVTVTRSGYVDEEQTLGSSTERVVVAAGSAASAGLQFDLAANYTVKYASNFDASTPLKPTNLDVSLLSTYATAYRPAATNPMKLHPFSTGYTGLAGHYLDPTIPSTPTGGCASVDPAAWPAKTVGATVYTGTREPRKGAAAGDPQDLNVPMGVARVAYASGGSGRYLNAVSQATGPGTDDPGCAVGMSYTFGQVLGTAAGSVTIALPFGSWKLYVTTSATATTGQVAATSVTFPAMTVATTAPSSVATSGIVTFDPRVAP